MSIGIYTVIFSLLTEAVLGVTVEQKDLSMTKGEGKSVYISCKVTELTTDYVHWYQKKDGEALTRILYVKKNSPVIRDNHLEVNDFDVRTQSDNFDLKIAKLKKSHSAVYYCASWKRDATVTLNIHSLYKNPDDKEKTSPTVSVYPVSNEANGTSVLLCQAQGMFPDLVKFTWKDLNGRQVQASEGGYELLEQRDGQDQNIRITSMLIIDQSKVTSYQYTCFVKHEGEEKIGIIPKDEQPAAPSSCIEQQTEQQEENLISDLFKLSHSLYLFSVTYVMLLVKNLLYFCTVIFLLYKRNSANKEMLGGNAR
ncbi:T-cell receptor gamma chain C region DFL12 [Ictalurus punctatus]|uniref:T-cell receptor gamma chain C region DFL12 n=1 Tax=Ictalurus punctatus TaxID=7998 RepID=UPI0023572373|nr:T-cell receptor gamma chain C region DFL12 [Ictalurus punctatus]